MTQRWGTTASAFGGAARLLAFGGDELGGSFG